MNAVTTPDLARVSRNCARGAHHRCLGQVYVYPPVDGRSLFPCECVAPDCTHDQTAR